MIEYKKHIDHYSLEGGGWYSKHVPENIWGNKELAEHYLSKYWLPEREYKKKWKPIQDKIFISQNGLPDLIFAPIFKLLVLRGGCLFVQEDFEQLKSVLLSIGEIEFVIIQNTQDIMSGEPMFRMKFPANISWGELMSGNYISALLFEMPYNEYFVFGASEKWGKYSANDYELPLDIIGFKSEFSSIFKEQFKQLKEEWDEVKEWLPQNYKELVKS